MAKKKFPLLGEHSIEKRSFPRMKAVLKQFEKKEFKKLVDRKRSDQVNRTLLKWIQGKKGTAFLLPEVLDYIEQIDKNEVLHHYTFSSFELWLNQFSGLSFEENYEVRAKIVGKWVERGEYQVLFPIGMGKVYEGTHFVTAHKSPDLDTTIASFWGWLDAFAARVSEGQHVWNLPGGPPPSQIEIDWIFRDVFGPAVFTHLPKTRTALSLTGNDLMSQKGMVRAVPEESIASIDHERDQNAVVIVDEEGFYLGDWRSLDVESVRQVIILFSSCLRWFENTFHLNLITLFAKEKLHEKEITPLLKMLFSLELADCEPAQEFTAKQAREVDDFLVKVLSVKKGLRSTFEELGIRLAKMGGIPFDGLERIAEGMKKAKLFDSKGNLQEARPRIFSFLEKAVRGLHEAILKIRTRLEKLDVALLTKNDVFGHHATYVTVRDDVEEIRAKMASYSYLTVADLDHGRIYPVGVILAGDLRKNILGTVSLRDFCNRDEMTIPSYLEVISVIDHHKTALNTFTPPLAVIADVQSSNTLVAQKAFEINDRYSLRGQDAKGVNAQIKANGSKATPEATRLLEKLLKKRKIVQEKSAFFIHEEREYLEYLHFLYGILDDTDLLSKVSSIDVECVAALLNRMKSLVAKEEVEIVSLDDLPRNKSFPKKAAQRILQNEDMYSLYRKVYEYREKEVEKNIHHCVKGEKSNIFADTKEQNGCCRVGQTKMFAKNIPYFEKHADQIRHVWLESAKAVYKDKAEIDLHIHMISTIVSAEEVYKGTEGKHAHKDELWIWMAPTETAVEHLKRFLSAFKSSPGFKNNSSEVEFLGPNANELAEIFTESFMEIPQSKSKGHLPIAVLRYNSGSFNSRKAMVSPFLPTLES